MFRDETILRYLESVDQAPAVESATHTEWTEGMDALAFFRENTFGDVAVAISRPHFGVYSVLVPLEKLTGDYLSDLLKWNFVSGSTAWSFGVGRDKDSREPWGVVHNPLGFTSSQILDSGEVIVFLRHFSGRKTKPEYLEVNQRLAHVTQIHWIEDRHAYSRIDENGDVVDVVQFHDFTNGHLATIEAASLDHYLFVSNQAMVRIFDVHRCVDWNQWRTFQDKDEEVTEILRESSLIAEHMTLRGPDCVDGSTLRGAQVLRSVGDREAHLVKLLGEDPEQEREVSFLVADRPGGQVREWPPMAGTVRRPRTRGWPPDPITPTFFRGEVLSRFKRHPEKYRLTQSSVECRDAWELRSYDVNGAGQVYAYLKDLWSLPYREQLYWRAFNEPPKAGLSERSIQQDFEARYWEGPDPLRMLTNVLAEFPPASHDGQPTAIWNSTQSNSREAMTGLHYVVTDSPKDWGDEILELAKVVVEGIRVKPLKWLARSLGCIEAQLPDVRSLKLLHAVLVAKKVGDETIEAVHGPLVRLNQLRSQAGIAHRGSDLPPGDLRVHYRNLLTDIANSMTELARLIREGIFNHPSTSSTDLIGKPPTPK